MKTVFLHVEGWADDCTVQFPTAKVRNRTAKPKISAHTLSPPVNVFPWVNSYRSQNFCLPPNPSHPSLHLSLLRTQISSPSHKDASSSPRSAPVLVSTFYLSVYNTSLRWANSRNQTETTTDKVKQPSKAKGTESTAHSCWKHCDRWGMRCCTPCILTHGLIEFIMRTTSPHYEYHTVFCSCGRNSASSETCSG